MTELSDHGSTDSVRRFNCPISSVSTVVTALHLSIRRYGNHDGADSMILKFKVALATSMSESDWDLTLTERLSRDIARAGGFVAHCIYFFLQGFRF